MVRGLSAWAWRLAVLAGVCVCLRCAVQNMFSSLFVFTGRRKTVVDGRNHCGGLAGVWWYSCGGGRGGGFSEATRILFASTMGTHHLSSLVVVVMVVVVVVVVVTVLVGVWLTAHDESIMTRCPVLAVHSRGASLSRRLLVDKCMCGGGT